MVKEKNYRSWMAIFVSNINQLTRCFAINSDLDHK